MTLTKLSLSYPVAVVVACLLLMIFGFISLFRLPVQLAPDIERPDITIAAFWRASAPNEVPRDALVLRSEGVSIMDS